MDNADHALRPGMYTAVRLQVPATRLSALPPDVGEKQKRSFEQGLVLAVPEGAVIDTGSRKLVYREAGPDLYEGVEVQLGPRCGAYYPVVRGLEAGDKVATAGSFLIDAETRLTAGAGSTYFGASGGPHGDRQAAAVRPSTTRDEDETVEAALDKLSSGDQALARAQGYCPVLGTRLGKMGVPVKVLLKGQPAFLCCKGCVRSARADEQGTLNKVTEQKTRAKTGRSPASPMGTPPAASPGAEDAEVKANLAKLSPEDRRLAESQRLCPITGEPLGAMGKPIKLAVKGRPVFICCKGCKEKVLGHPDEVLRKVEQLKAKGKAPPPPE
jgi:hypothetical protein